MALQIRGIPSRIESLVQQLNDDTDIRGNIIGLIEEARTLSAKFTEIKQTEGLNVLQNKQALMKVRNPSEVDVLNLKYALKALQKCLQDKRDNMFIFQGHVHKCIEECRARSRKHEQSIEQRNIEIMSLSSQINNLEGMITSCESDAENEDKRANYYEENARELNQTANERRETGIKSSALIFGIGLITAPFTGGVSLAVASGAAAGTLGGSFLSAKECDDLARSHRSTARNKRRKAEYHRETKRKYTIELEDKEKEVCLNNLRNVKVESARRNLNEIELQLYREIANLDAVITHVQDLDATLYETEQLGDAFKIIQNAFSKNPEKLEGRGQLYLNKLKDKWQCVERDLMCTNCSQVNN